MDEGDLRDVGLMSSVTDQVGRLVTLAAQVGVEGVICAPREVELVKKTSPSLLAVTPGIRTAGASNDDQKRATTPESAMEMGADLLVIGRSITAAPDPVAAASKIAESLAATAD
jgi:orotidine-5'-phosphate decarboxylase